MHIYIFFKIGDVRKIVQIVNRFSFYICMNHIFNIWKILLAQAMLLIFYITLYSFHELCFIGSLFAFKQIFKTNFLLNGRLWNHRMKSYLLISICH